MSRIKRTQLENMRIGFPSLEDRVEMLEEIISGIVTGQDKSKFDDLMAKMDQMDIDFPDRGDVNR